MPQITGSILYNDFQQFAFLVEGNSQSLLAIDVQPFNNIGPQDARFAFNFLKQKGIVRGAAVNFVGQRIVINGSPVILITQPF